MGLQGAANRGLALALIEAAQSGRLPFARLVADDRVHVEARHGRLLVRPAESLAGLIEVRGLGIRRLPYEPVAVVGLVVDLGQPDAARLPSGNERTATVASVTLPRLAVASCADATAVLLAALGTVEAGS